MTGFSQLDAQIPGATRQVRNEGAWREAKFAHCPFAPSDVESEGHQAIDEVVARGDGVEHLAYGHDLGITLGKLLRIPTSTEVLPFRHVARLRGRSGRSIVVRRLGGGRWMKQHCMDGRER